MPPSWSRAGGPSRAGALQTETLPRFEDRVYWAMIRDSNAGNLLERVRRYEVTLERSLLSILHELERRQLRRAGEQTSAPAVLDVHVNSDD